MKIGLISDTHGLVRPEALHALRGVDAIVHAGDVGGPHVLEALEALAPVHAIRGNVDTPGHLRTSKRKRKDLDPAWAEALPDRLTIALDGVTIHVVHAIDDLKLDAQPAPVDVVVSGHSHRPSIERNGDVLYVNPGSAGPRRFSLPVSVATLALRGGAAHAEIITLAV